MDTQTLLTIHKRVITHDKRIRVTNNNFHWNLHIKEVDENDKGFYMCQINTEPMVSQMGYLDVMGKSFKFCGNTELYYFIFIFFPFRYCLM